MRHAKAHAKGLETRLYQKRSSYVSLGETESTREASSDRQKQRHAQRSVVLLEVSQPYLYILYHYNEDSYSK